MSIVTKTRAARMPVTAKLLRSVPCVYSALTPGRARYFHEEYTSANVTSANAMTHMSVVYQNRASARYPSRDASTVVNQENGQWCISSPRWTVTIREPLSLIHI